MERSELADLERRYTTALFDDVIPFWLSHGVDRERGGFLTGLDRMGEVIETDKSVWFQGRMSWVFATLYTDFRRDERYLEAARQGIDFLERWCFDRDGRMFFRLTREGRPLIKRKRYFFSETFAIIALAAFARATGDRRYVEKARGVLETVDRVRGTPPADPKWNPEVRPSSGYAEPMILLATLQELRMADPGRSEEYNRRIDGLLAEMRRFLKPELKAVLEQIGPDGELQDHFEGRLLNPGHAIESAWFVMEESKQRGVDPQLLKHGLTILDWMWSWGWDETHGGIIYFRDVLGKPCTDYWHDMKFWWPQNEAVIATLMAHALTGEERYAEWFRKIDSWAHARFPDSVGGEWFGYLHRDGSVATTLKGNMWKGCFHLPRMYMRSLQIVRSLGTA